MATDFDTQDAKAAFLTVEGHTLNGTREVFRRMRLGDSLCRNVHRIDHTCVWDGIQSMSTGKKEAMGLTTAREDMENTHSDKNTTHLSSEQDG